DVCSSDLEGGHLSEGPLAGEPENDQQEDVDAEDLHERVHSTSSSARRGRRAWLDWRLRGARSRRARHPLHGYTSWANARSAPPSTPSLPDTLHAFVGSM